jgi:hypothetical protein
MIGALVAVAAELSGEPAPRPLTPATAELVPWWRACRNITHV